MPRPSKDGSPANPPNRRCLTELFVRKTRPKSVAVNVWDEKERGLCVRIQPSGFRSFKFVYSIRGRARWYHIGQVPLSDARRIAAKLQLAVAEGKDPLAERRAERGQGSFAEVHTRYLETYAKKRNKSWQQANRLVRRFLLPRWGKLDAASISRADARNLIGNIAAPVVANQVLASCYPKWGELDVGSLARADVRQLIGSISAPVVANQTLAAASAIFSWAVKQEIVQLNPCAGIERNETKSRERVLSDTEVPKFWAAFDDAGLVAIAALKAILLTGQRPGEVVHMRREHIVDGWWEMPGEPVAALGWNGTKNGASHRVWLPAPVQALLAELDEFTGFVFAGPRGRPVHGLDAAMRAACKKLGVERATPHDLRRTFSTKVTALGFGREALNRVTNHKEGGIASVYDRHEYADENRKVMEAVADYLIRLAE